MSLEFTRDYSDHTLINNNSAQYTKLYKLNEADASDIHKGDLVLLRTKCGQYQIFIATEDADFDNTLHLSKYSEMEFTKFEDSESSSCCCN